MGKRQNQIRELLIKYEYGLTAREMASMLEGLEPKNVKNIAESEYSVYIDRWILDSRGKYEAVYCIHPPPEDCPKPELVIHETLHDGRQILTRFQATATGHYGTSRQ